MSILLDPSLVMGGRAKDWLLRVQRDGQAGHLHVPDYLYQVDPTQGRLPGAPGLLFRGSSEQVEPLTHLLNGAQRERHDQRKHRSLPQPWASHAHRQLILDVWAGLQDGHNLVARRADVLDRLIQSGVVAEVRALGTSAWAPGAVVQHLESGLSAELLDALWRRTRLVAALDQDSASSDEPRIVVWDDGPYGVGRWR